MKSIKPAIKDLLGELPFAAEAYWYLRQPGKPLNPTLSLTKLEELLPQWTAQAAAALAAQPSQRRQPGKHVLVFATLRFWMEHAALVGLALAGQGHKVSFAYLPYGNWKLSLHPFDARRQNLYTLNVLRKAEPLMEIVPLLTEKKADRLPAELEKAIETNALRDTQYSLQVEDVDLHSDLYELRLARDTAAARSALAWLQACRPDVVVIPNGTILEFGALYQTAIYLGIPVVTYEFGEQQRRIWLAKDREVMRQDTDELWAARRERPLDPAQLEQVRTLFASRQRASLWENFARRWQGVPSQGGEQVRASLGLDARPVVLLATNVIGDSLTLGRQVFSDSMTEWLEKTVQYFANRPDVQFVARIHPGELITKGPSVADVVHKVLPNLPEHVHLVPADAKVNTYDIVEIADLGLVYTTTVGLEMAMSGVPVIAVGNTHYRGRGFTLDAATWDEYFTLLDRALGDPQSFRLTQEQVSQAWNYAYRFFFDYPQAFPWHILHIWKDLEEWPLSRVLSDEGQATFGKTFRYLSGEKIDWE